VVEASYLELIRGESTAQTLSDVVPVGGATDNRRFKGRGAMQEDFTTVTYNILCRASFLVVPWYKSSRVTLN
jgi:hypothetical protein